MYRIFLLLVIRDVLQSGPQARGCRQVLGLRSRGDSEQAFDERSLTGNVVLR